MLQPGNKIYPSLVKDYYSGTIAEVIDGRISFENGTDLLLIGEPFE
jgi:hypothetical protein